jgi:hypothetical protein
MENMHGGPHEDGGAAIGFWGLALVPWHHLGVLLGRAVLPAVPRPALRARADAILPAFSCPKS